MAIVITDNKHYTEIANAIRNINNTSDTYTPSQMSDAIGALINYAKISVTAVGATSVTAESGSLRKTGFNKNGTFMFYNCTAGSWTLTATIDGVDKTSSVTIPSSNPQFVYNITIS